MRILREFLLLGVLFCLFTVGSLMLWSSSTVAKESTQGRMHLAAAQTNSIPEQGGNSPTAKAIAGAQGGQVLGAGVIYAPRDVVDLTRLVLETSRDQTTHVTDLIGHGTVVIVVFFTLLGAVGGAFGLHKLRDIETKANDEVKKFERYLEVSRGTTDAMEKEFRQSIEAAAADLKTSKERADTLEKEFTQSIALATEDLHRELNDQIELLGARVEIDQSMKAELNRDQTNRLLTNASKRIKTVLDRNQVSVEAKIRGLADLAWAQKRLGDIEQSLEHILSAAAAAKEQKPGMYPLLAFNAACYSSLLNKPNACDWLAEAIRVAPHYKQSARTDPDFDTIKDSQRFKELVA